MESGASIEGTWEHGKMVASVSKLTFFRRNRTEPDLDCPQCEINFLISFAWVEGGIDVGDPMLKIEKFCEGVRAPPTPQKSEN